ncbi:MAG: alpha/beta fold hydrolase [candidate division WS1 bacterium]|jgi:dienelactone hydrolase|nr:alpha/beta fold hydrolase [candidate division WS1 bacterium]
MVSAETLRAEERFFFSHEDCRLVGMLHRPSSPPRAGVILLHGWAGYRAGPHQMFIKLARRAAAAGLTCLRFDFRGRGDSEGDPAAASLSTMISDALHAAEVLAERCGALPLALVGDCSGSEVALGAGPLMPGCERLVLWSAPPVGAERQQMHQAKRRNVLMQYLRKALQPQTWRRLLQRELRLDMVGKALRSGGLGAGELGQDSDREIDWRRRFLDFPGHILFIYGSNDPATPACLEHYEYLSQQAGRPWEVHLVEGANHAFYSLAWEREVIDRTLHWLGEWADGPRSGHG